MTVVNSDDLPEGMKEHQRIAHQIAEQTCEQVWNIAAEANAQIGKQISGNDALSFLATILQDFAARWISLMDDIRQKDDAGILREDLLKDLMNGILSTIGCTATYEDEAPLLDGIKRLKK